MVYVSITIVCMIAMIFMIMKSHLLANDTWWAMYIITLLIMIYSIYRLGDGL